MNLYNLKNIDLKNKLEDKVTAIKNQEDNIKEEKPVDVKRDKDLNLKKDIKKKYESWK